MYTDEDLDYAVKKGIFTDASVAEFRTQLALLKNTVSADEENFRLITSFNDIFVVIACLLLLFSSLWVIGALSGGLGFLMFTLLSWGLAEFFVRKRKMALPAIVLLLCFIGGVFALCQILFSSLSETSYSYSTALTAVAAYFHWRRFKVPITIAAGTAASIGFIIAFLFSILPITKDWLLIILFFSGVIAFVFAMYWDISDRNRTTRRSDVAFWLHLLSAPLIIHPVFLKIGIFEGNENLGSMAIVICLYLLITFVSLVVDRRALMVSSLMYVLYALSNLLKVYGMVGVSFAFTGVIIGTALLLLSAFWYSTRANLLTFLPSSVQKYVPEFKSQNSYRKA